MELSTLHVSSAGQGASVAALPAASSAISPQALQVISNIAADTALSNSERNGLVAAVATFDQTDLSPATKAGMFEQVEGFGTYLRNTSSNSWPRWQQMTALRVYGLNIDQGKKSAVEEVTAQFKAQLNNVAQSRGVSVEHVAATAQHVARAAPQIHHAAPAKAAAPVAQPTPKSTITEQVATKAIKVDTTA